MSLDTNFLRDAISRLEEGLDVYRSDPSQTLIRDGLVQRFEFTYEISHRILKRYLRSVSATPEEYDSMPFADLVRSGSQQGLLLRGWPEWKEFRHMRALTSHTYDEAVALEVVARIPVFLDEARYLRDRLTERLNR
jgi:nucleotidyltransferase substrate binding protein (TIGR01987 family)